MKTLVLASAFFLSTAVMAMPVESWEFPAPKVTDHQYSSVKVVSESESDDPSTQTYGVSKKSREMASEKEEIKRGPSSTKDEVKEVEHQLPPRPWNFKGRQY